MKLSLIMPGRVEFMRMGSLLTDPPPAVDFSTNPRTRRTFHVRSDQVGYEWREATKTDRKCRNAQRPMICLRPLSHLQSTSSQKGVTSILFLFPNETNKSHGNQKVSSTGTCSSSPSKIKFSPLHSLEPLLQVRQYHVFASNLNLISHRTNNLETQPLRIERLPHPSLRHVRLPKWHHALH